MRFHYDKQEDAFYIRFHEGAYAQSDEVAKGVIIDYDARGKIIGLEVLNASEKFPHDFSAMLLKRKLPAALHSGSRAKQPA